MSVTEQRYKAVLAVIADGRTVGEVASEWGVCRQTMHRWLARYESEGLEGLGNHSSRPARCPHQMPPEVEAMVLEMRRAHTYWGARRIAFELADHGIGVAARVAAYVGPLLGWTAADLPGEVDRYRAAITRVFGIDPDGQSSLGSSAS